MALVALQWWRTLELSSEKRRGCLGAGSWLLCRLVTHFVTLHAFLWRVVSFLRLVSWTWVFRALDDRVSNNKT